MKIIALVNQKGGVAKTTTSANLAWGLALKGKKVLAIDLDPQGHLTKSMGATAGINSALEWLTKELPLDIVVKQVSGGVDLIAADINLANLEPELNRMLIDREYVLHKALKNINTYDYVVIDSSPALSNITINILAASDRIIIPFRPDYLSKDGVRSLLGTAEAIALRMNPKLKIAGYLPTMVDKRCNNSVSFKEAEELAKQYGGQVFGEGIRLASILTKAPEKGISIYELDKNSNAAKDYMAFVDAFLEGETHGK